MEVHAGLAAGRYADAGVYRSGEVVPVPGFGGVAVPVDKLFESPLPR